MKHLTKCPKCGQEHSQGAYRAAQVIMSGKRALATKWGNKTECGVAAIIDNLTQTPGLLRVVESVFLWNLSKNIGRKKAAPLYAHIANDASAVLVEYERGQE